MVLRAMTYNVRYFGHVAVVAGAASTRKGIVGITDAIAALDPLPDVICLQEVESRSLRSSLSHTPSHLNETQLEAMMRQLDWALHERRREHRYLPHYYPAHAYRVQNAHLYTTGLAILVREDRRVLPTDPGARVDITHRRRGPTAKWKQSRICAHLRIDTPEGEVDIFNTHLSLPAFLTRDFYRITERMGYGDNQEREVEALAAFVAARRQSDRFLVCGDFNSLPGSPVYQAVLDKLGVSDPFPAAVGSTSVDELRQRWPTAGFLRFRFRLDHLFSGPGLRWLAFEDTHPFGDSAGRWHGLSDHVPIVGTFSA